LVKLNLATQAVVVVALAIIVGCYWGLPWTPLRIAGLAIAIPSFLLFALARVQLGRAFSVQAKATTLVTTGLYSRIRTPIYFFSAPMIAGVFLWANHPWWLLIFVVVIPLQVVRSRKEEQVLTEKFGTAYLEYKLRTWF
jgi:protein-S-isoprenylcysteine O-methyltransferase Ste14